MKPPYSFVRLLQAIFLARTEIFHGSLGVAAIIIVGTASPALAQTGGAEPNIDLVLQPGQLELRPSFGTCSYYFRPLHEGPEMYAAEFRRAGDSVWHPAFAPVTDRPAGIWKGSIFQLAEDALWQIRLVERGKNHTVVSGEFRTWTSSPPIAKVIDLSQLPVSEEGGLVLSDQGSPDRWIKYIAPKGWMMRRTYHAQDPEIAAITVRGAKFVILEGLTIEGGLRHGILVEKSESVRILNCEISGWGRVGEQRFINTGNRGKYFDVNGNVISVDAGVEVNRSRDTVIERCYIHDPRGRSNSWMFQHPSGPCGIHLNFARGGTVIRWNDIVGSDEHRWDDVIEGTSNSSEVGGFYRDSDIVGNYLAFGNDDGVELEGGGMNVRFVGNEIEGTTCGVSTGAGLLGPQFIVGNLITNPGDESGLSLMLFKNSHGTVQGGKRYFINNTLIGPGDAAYGSYSKPLPGAHIGTMRNNIFISNGSREIGEWGRTENYDSDLFWTKGSVEHSRKFLESFRKFGQEPHGVAADPGFVDLDGGDYHLAANSAARGLAAVVTNLNDAGGDLGAFSDASVEIPARPFSLRTSLRHVRFDVVERPRDTTQKVVLSWGQGEKQPLKFEIRKNHVFDWFTIRPERGVVLPGQTLVLTVEVKPARLAERPLFKGAFLVRSENGLSRPISVYARGDYHEDLRPQAAPHSVYLPALPTPSAAGTLESSDAENIVGGKFLKLSAAIGASGISSAFELSANGNYALLARVGIYDDLIERRGFELSVDGGATTSLTVTDDYQWNVSDRRFRVVFLSALGELAAGPHRLQINASKGDIKVNELIITDHPEVFFAQYWQRERVK